MKKIKITKDGPYLVTGSIPLKEQIIKSTGDGNVYIEGKKFEHLENYNLCRCGKSKNMPFCDGSHIHDNFNGKTKTSRKNFSDKAKKYYGENIILEDVEELCAFARFCHNSVGDVWNLTEFGETKEEEEMAIKLACDCPAGRLVMHDKKTGIAIEPSFEDSIVILKDQERKCDGPIWVRGNVEIEDENGVVLEKRNRITLCRCGKSKNKPYCDAEHLNDQFYDENL